MSAVRKVCEKAVVVKRLTHFPWDEFSKLVFVQYQTLSLSSVCPLLFELWINTGGRWKVCANSPLNKVYPGQSFPCTSAAQRPLPVFFFVVTSKLIGSRDTSLSSSHVSNHILSTFLRHLPPVAETHCWFRPQPISSFQALSSLDFYQALWHYFMSYCELMGESIVALYKHMSYY